MIHMRKVFRCRRLSGCYLVSFSMKRMRNKFIVPCSVVQTHFCEYIYLTVYFSSVKRTAQIWTVCHDLLTFMLFQTLFLQWNAKEDSVKMSQDPLFFFFCPPKSQWGPLLFYTHLISKLSYFLAFHR